MRTSILLPENVRPLSHRLLALVTKGCARSLGVWTVEEVFDQAARGFLQFWISYEPETDGEPIHAIALTRQTPDCEAIEVVLVAGQGRALWIDQFEEIKAFARHNGVKTVRFLGRLGWERVFPEAKIIRHLYEMEA